MAEYTPHTEGQETPRSEERQQDEQTQYNLRRIFAGTELHRVIHSQ